MKFMAKDESSAESDISSAKAFNTVKRHLYVLLAYDQQEGCFMIAPQKMRVSTCFNAFIAGIAQKGHLQTAGTVILNILNIIWRVAQQMVVFDSSSGKRLTIAAFGRNRARAARVSSLGAKPRLQQPSVELG
ncbi:UNVERIFIED_CONTAM: hypothetical protein K2H54_031580 [Gekko kuhli]